MTSDVLLSQATDKYPIRTDCILKFTGDLTLPTDFPNESEFLNSERIKRRWLGFIRLQNDFCIYYTLIFMVVKLKIACFDGKLIRYRLYNSFDAFDNCQ